MTDNEALIKATEALAKIESHERICAQRWGFVQTLLIAVIVKLLTVLGLLGWALFLRGPAT